MRDFTVLVLEGAYATGVSVTLDLLSAAQIAASAAGAGPRWELCSLTGGPVRLAGGMTVETRRLPPRAARDGSVWVIPGLAATNAAAVARRLAAPDAKRAALRLREHVRQRRPRRRFLLCRIPAAGRRAAVRSSCHHHLVAGGAAA